MQKFELEYFNLEFQKDVNVVQAFLEFTNDVFRYRSEYDSSIPKDKNDLTLGWEDNYTNFDIRFKRIAMVSVERYWDEKNNYWRIELEAMGYPNTIKLYFKEHDHKVDTMHKFLNNYVFNPKFRV